jgi:hypothetical protein
MNFSPSSPAYGTVYRITGGFPPECRNKHFEEGFTKDLQNNESVFIKAS